MRFHALAAAIGAIALGACAGRPGSPIFASPTVVSPSPASRATDPMPPEERPELPPEDRPDAPPAERRDARPRKSRDARAKDSREDRSDARAKSRSKDPAEARLKDRKDPKEQPEAHVRAVSAAPIREVSAADPPPSRGADRPDRPGAATSPKARASKSTDSDAPDSNGPDSNGPDSDAADSNASRSAAPDRDESGSDAKSAGPGRAKLRAPHRGAEPAPPPARAPADLRALVGRRDARDSLAAVAAWSRGLGAPLAATTGAELVSWAAETHRLRPATEPPRPGDLLVFDQAVSDDPADLVALVLDGDERGVTELLYVGAGVVRRGLVDASRPAVHRDAQGATVNTYLRHGRRWPAKGMHYLAGELLAHVVRMR
jgi:hypothetical protein